jgi:hypothetical protein
VGLKTGVGVWVAVGKLVGVCCLVECKGERENVVLVMIGAFVVEDILAGNALPVGRNTKDRNLHTEHVYIQKCDMIYTVELLLNEPLGTTERVNFISVLTINYQS